MRSIYLLLMLIGSLSASAFVPNTNVIDEVSVFDGVTADYEFAAPEVLFVEPGFTPETVPLEFLEIYGMCGNYKSVESSDDLETNDYSSWQNSNKRLFKNETEPDKVLHIDPGN